MTYTDTSQRGLWLLHPGLVASGATLLMATFVTDTVYWRTLLFQWNNFSDWLLVAGLIITGFAALAFIIDLVRRRVRRVSWLRLLALAVVALLSILNAFVHSRDAYTAVVPEGIILSGVVTLILLVVGLGGGWSLAELPLVYRPRAREI